MFGLKLKMEMSFWLTLKCYLMILSIRYVTDIGHKVQKFGYTFERVFESLIQKKESFYSNSLQMFLFHGLQKC